MHAPGKTLGICACAALWLAACAAPPTMLPLPAVERSKTLGNIAQIPTTPQLQSYTRENGSTEYLIGRKDILEITLRDVEVVQEKVAVRSDGNVSFSMVENVRAAGRTPTQLDSAITAELSRFLRHPKVDVKVEEYKSKFVSVLGAIEEVASSDVKTGQGRYALKGRSTVLDVILEAGGFTPDAQLDRVRLVRADQPYELDLQKLLDSGDLSDNVVVQDGDIIIVPGSALRNKKVVVLGEVENPNVYLLSTNTNLLDALSQAGGLTDDALRDDIRVIRAVGGKAQMFSANFKRLVSRGDMQHNIALRNDDIVYVPRSFMGDVNDVLRKIDPLLDVLLLPATYRDLYTTGGGLRIDTGPAPVQGGTSGFTRTLPGTGAIGKAVVPQEEKKAKKTADKNEKKKKK